MKLRSKALVLFTALLSCTSVTASSLVKESLQNNQKRLTKEEIEVVCTKQYAEQVINYVNSITPHWENRELVNGEFKMPFWYDIKGEKPEKGYPMYISMHGGGGAPSEVNDKQWENQKKLYGVVPGIYWVPRAPTDSWNLWHQDYMEEFLLQAVTYAVNVLDADPNRIYLTGYSAGGDGTYNLAPRLADRFAAAAMMAGHPGDANALNLRNLPFAIYMGDKDTAYDRNKHAATWGKTLDQLQEKDPAGYVHHVVIYPEKGHWMDNEDKEAIAWMAQFTRSPYPNHIIWVQDDVLATRKYNLSVENPAEGKSLVVSYDFANNRAEIESSDYDQVTFWFNDSMLNLDEPIVISYKGKELFKGVVERTSNNIEMSIANRFDSYYAFSAQVTVKL
ncbi:MAG: dienelactone hydrolase family protein [Phocaeicola sp.]